MTRALPDTDFPETREFWAAAARSELVIPRCAGCRAWVWYPKPACPSCGGEELAWERVSGDGTLFSWALVTRALFPPFASQVPYVTGLVALAEDPAVRIVTRIVDWDARRLEVDMPVRVVFRDLEFPDEEGRVPAPFFAPVSEAPA